MAKTKFDVGAIGDAKAIPGVTAQNYILPAERFEDAKGAAMEYARKAGKCFMIEPNMFEHRAVWAKYFTLKGMRDRKKWMRWWLEGEHPHRRIYAVPGEWPWQFDQSVSEAMCR